MRRTTGLVTRSVGAAVLVTSLSGCWLQLGGGADRNYHNDREDTVTPENVASLDEEWSAEFDGGISEPIVSGNRAYVAHWPDDEPLQIRAMNTGTGTTLWETEVTTATGQNNNGVVPELALSAGRLWLGYLAYHDGPSGLIPESGLARLDPDDGSILEVEGDIVGNVPPVIGGGIVAYLRFPHELVVRDQETFDVLWTASYTEDRTGPLDMAMADGTIYVTSWHALSGYDAAGCGASTCSPSWTVTDDVDTDGLAAASDEVTDGVVVRSITDAWDLDDERHVPSRLEVRSGHSGTIQWDAEITSTTGHLAVSDDFVYAGSQEIESLLPDGPPTVGVDALQAFTREGCQASDCDPEWSVPLDGPPSQPVSGGGVVYTSAGGTLYALDAAGCDTTTCEPIAEFPDGGEPRSLAEGRLYTTQSGDAGTVLSAYTVDG